MEGAAGPKVNMKDVDRALAAAKARKAAKAANPGSEPIEGQDGTKDSVETKAEKRPKLTDEEKAARKEQQAADKAKRAEERSKARDEKRALQQASRGPAHMRKVQKAAENLPILSQAAQVLLAEATGSLNQVDLTALASHLQHHTRTKATELALSQKVEAGQRVRIIAGTDPRHIGKEGTVSKAQRIRCYVKVDGLAKDAYFYTSDVQVIESAAKAEEPAA